ncbi:MAG TPA: hypothetical protein VFN11_14320 [Ktedonobacterales bacterium]|nr:hypothetical protein [Ktedonobacterales bacterium]
MMSDEGERIILRAEVDAEVERLRAENAAMREIVEAVAALDLEYEDEYLEFFCPACQAFVSADWGRGRKPSGMTGKQWAEQRIKHEPDCPVIKARALIATD